MRRLNRLILVILVACFALSLSGCGCSWWGDDEIKKPFDDKDTKVVPLPPPKRKDDDKKEGDIIDVDTHKGDGTDKIVVKEKVDTTLEEADKKEEPEAVPQEKLDTIYFDYDMSSIRSDAAEALSHNASWLVRDDNADVKLSIEGHCDERGTDEYNMALGERRAVSAKKYLVTLGVEESRLTVISYGELRRAVNRSDESAWSKNRRVEFIILEK